MTAPHGPRPLCKRVAFDKHPEQRILPDCPDERCVKSLPWYKRAHDCTTTKRDRAGARAQLPQTTCDAIEQVTDPIKRAQLTATLLRMELVNGYSYDPD